MKRNKRQLYVMIFVFVVIALAYTCRMLDMYDIGSGYPGDVRAALYIVLLALWGYILRKSAFILIMKVTGYRDLSMEF